LIGGSCIVAPTGQIVAQALTVGDELVIARCDLELARSYKETTFNFARHREPEQYRSDRRAQGAARAVSRRGGA
jgi:N-carbamoyl-D-amino-acid hydrolase